MGLLRDYELPDAPEYDDIAVADEQEQLAELERDAQRVPQGGVRHSTAFIVEAMVLLVFLVLALAMTTKMTIGARSDAALASDLSRAVALAQNTAEEFSADPAGFAASPTIIREGEGGLRAQCTVEAEQRTAGTMYTAHIVVTGGDSVLAQRARAKAAAAGEGGSAVGDAAGTADDAGADGSEVYCVDTSAYVSGGGAADE